MKPKIGDYMFYYNTTINKWRYAKIEDMKNDILKGDFRNLDGNRCWSGVLHKNAVKLAKTFNEMKEKIALEEL